MTSVTSVTSVTYVFQTSVNLMHRLHEAVQPPPRNLTSLGVNQVQQSAHCILLVRALTGCICKNVHLTTVFS